MRVVWLTCVPLPDVGDEFSGFIRSRLEMCREMSKRGHRMHLVGRSKRYRHWPAGLERDFSITALPRWILGPLGGIVHALALLLYANCLVLWHRPEIVLVEIHAVLHLLPVAILHRLGVIPTCVVLEMRTFPTTDDQVEWKDVWRGRARLALLLAGRFFSGMTVITPYMRELLARQLDIPEDKVGVWSSGVDLAEFAPRDGSAMRRKLGLCGRFVIMYHGSLFWSRAIRESFEAVLSLVPNCPDIVFVVLGDTLAGEGKMIAARLQQLADCRGAAEHLLFLQSVPHSQVADYLAIADIGISIYHHLLCYRTSSPLKLLEYMAMEKPVVVTDMEAHRYVLGDSPCAFYAATARVADIAAAFARAYEQREALGRLGKIGREIVSQRFTWKSQADKLNDYIAPLL